MLVVVELAHALAVLAAQKYMVAELDLVALAAQNQLAILAEEVALLVLLVMVVLVDIPQVDPGLLEQEAAVVAVVQEVLLEKALMVVAV